MPLPNWPAKCLTSLYEKISFLQQEISRFPDDTDESAETVIKKRLAVIKLANQAITEVDLILSMEFDIKKIEQVIGISFNDLNAKISFFYYIRAENTFCVLKQLQLSLDNPNIFSEKTLKMLLRIRAQNFNKEISDLALLQRIKRDAYEALCFDPTKNYRAWYQNIASHALGNPTNILVKYSEEGFFEKRIALQHISNQSPDSLSASCFGFRR